jgi:hypothetical protein
MQHQLETESIFNQYKKIINESVDIEDIARTFESSAGEYGIDEYLQRLALLAHSYKDKHNILYDLESWLFNAVKSNVYELEQNSEDFNINDYKKGLRDIIANGEDSYFWDPSFDDDYKPEGTWNPRDQESINDYGAYDDDDFALNG